MGSQKIIVPDRAIAWVERAYKIPQPIYSRAWKAESGCAPPPGTLNKVEVACNHGNLRRIRKVLSGTHYLCVLEVKYNRRKPAWLWNELAHHLSRECKFPRDTAMSLCINNWTHNCNVTVENWAKTKNIKLKTARDYLYLGRRQLNRWHDEAIIKAWDSR